MWLLHLKPQGTTDFQRALWKQKGPCNLRFLLLFPFCPFKICHLEEAKPLIWDSLGKLIRKAKSQASERQKSLFSERGTALTAMPAFFCEVGMCEEACANHCIPELIPYMLLLKIAEDKKLVLWSRNTTEISSQHLQRKRASVRYMLVPHCPQVKKGPLILICLKSYLLNLWQTYWWRLVGPR